MGKLAEAYVDIGVNDAKVDSGLASVRAKLGRFVESAAGGGGGGGVKGLGAMLGESATGTAGVGLATGALKGIAVAGAAASVAIGTAMVVSAKKAADFGETVSKVKVTFGGAAGGMIEQADQLAERFGVVKKEALDAAAAFGLMGIAAGLNKDQAAGLGKEFVQLGLDMASYHNISNAEAFEKLRSGLAGESEPLRPLGILLSEDAVKAEALASGIIKVKRELTDAEKVAARASLIRKQAAPAVGDLERTKDSNANQLRKLEGELENAAVAFGEHLQDAMASAIKLAHELGDVLKSATGKDLAANIGAAARTAIDAPRVAIADPRKALMPGLLRAAKLIPGMGGIVGAGLDLAAGRADADLQEHANDVVGGMGGNLVPGAQDAERRKAVAEATAEADADEKWRKENERKNQKAREGEAPSVGKGLLGALKGAVGAMGAVAAGSKLEAAKGLATLRAMGVPAAGLRILGAGANLGRAVADAAEKGPENARKRDERAIDEKARQREKRRELAARPAELLNDPQELAQKGILNALEARNIGQDDAKHAAELSDRDAIDKLREVEENARDTLKEMAGNIAVMARNAGKNLGIIPR